MLLLFDENESFIYSTIGQQIDNATNGLLNFIRNEQIIMIFDTIIGMEE